MLLSNLTELKNDMVNKKWTICSLLFRYKTVEYISDEEKSAMVGI